GMRRREVRNGLTIPPRLTVSTLAQMALYPRWWVNVLTTEPLRFASLGARMVRWVTSSRGCSIRR
ncbi:MAG: hypothetical protein ACKOI2_01080, partial [Actinomycetota bacterium]